MHKILTLLLLACISFGWSADTVRVDTANVKAQPVTSEKAAEEKSVPAKVQLDPVVKSEEKQNQPAKARQDSTAKSVEKKSEPAKVKTVTNVESVEKTSVPVNSDSDSLLKSADKKNTPAISKPDPKVKSAEKEKTPAVSKPDPIVQSEEKEKTPAVSKPDPIVKSEEKEKTPAVSKPDPKVKSAEKEKTPAVSKPDPIVKSEEKKDVSVEAKPDSIIKSAEKKDVSVEAKPDSIVKSAEKKKTLPVPTKQVKKKAPAKTVKGKVAPADSKKPAPGLKAKTKTSNSKSQVVKSKLKPKKDSKTKKTPPDLAADKKAKAPPAKKQVQKTAPLTKTQTATKPPVAKADSASTIDDITGFFTTKTTQPNNKKDEKSVIGSTATNSGSMINTSKITISIILFIIGWFSLRYITAVLNLLSERWPKYRLTIKGTVPIVRILGWSGLITFIIVTVFQPDMKAVYAVATGSAVAIGFALQDILKNIFGGVVILFDKPFKVGDKISIDDHYGEVVNIGLRTVRIVTLDDSEISIPNMEIVSKSVSNSNTGSPDCQIAAEFFFPDDLDMDKAHILAQRCAYLSQYIYLNKPVAVVFQNQMYGLESRIKMRLKAYVFDHRFESPFKTDLSKTVYREFRNAGLIKTES